MRKTLKTLALTGSLLMLAASAQAANVVTIGQTSPGFVRKGCEQLGSITATWDQGSVMTAGDWFYMDLPIGSSICKPIDYVIVGQNSDGANAPGGNVTVWSGNMSNAVIAGVTGIMQIAAGDTNGPMTLNDEGAGPAATLTVVNGPVLRVSAADGERRVWFRVIGNAPNASVTVPADTSWTIRFLDGNKYANAADNNQMGILLNSKSDPTTISATQADMFGENATDLIGYNGTSTGAVPPHVENTLCANVTGTTQEWLLTNYDSAGDIYSFAGEFKIAHLVALVEYELQSCEDKNTVAPLQGDILMPDLQDTGCVFNYENQLAYTKDFCGTPSTFSWNRILIHGTSAFGEPGDRYDITVTSTTNGVYFGADVAVMAYNYTAQADACSTNGIAVTPANMYKYTSTSNTLVAAYDTGTCDVLSSARYTKQSSIGPNGATGTLTGIDLYNTLWVNLGDVVYDRGIVGASVEANFNIILDKYPCGEIFNDDRVVGTFVSTCPTVAVAGTTTLLYPFMVPLDGSAAPWWGGFTIVNAGSANGTCTVTVMEEDGDSGTMTTPTIDAGTQWNPYGNSNVLAALTPAGGNTGTLGDSNCAIQAVCQFGMGAGFAFTGTGNEGTGYTAYVLGAAGWSIN